MTVSLQKYFRILIWSKLNKLVFFTFNLFLLYSSAFGSNSDRRMDDASPLRGGAMALSPSERPAEGLKRDSLKRINNREGRKAAIMSAIVPGLGQIYNRKYWKVPIVYAGIGGFAYYGLLWNKDYQNYHNELLYRYANNQQVNSYPEYTTENLLTLKSQVKKYRDMCFIGAGIFYLLNIIDANVDGHMKSFDVSDNLSLVVKPRAFYCMDNKANFGAGLGLTLNFK